MHIFNLHHLHKVEEIQKETAQWKRWRLEYWGGLGGNVGVSN